MPGVSAVVVSYNAREYLRRTLRALRCQRGVELEMVVVDNASGDGSAKMVAAEFPEVTLIASESNLGLAEGVNRGLAVAQHQFICTSVLTTSPAAAATTCPLGSISVSAR
jgi:GT2 family glycosyltransferase